MKTCKECVRVFREASDWVYELEREDLFRVGVVPVDADASAQEALRTVTKMFPEIDPAEITRVPDRP